LTPTLPHWRSTVRADHSDRRVTAVNKDYKAYAELKAILKNDLDAAKTRTTKQSLGMGWVPVVAVAAVAVGAFYFLRAN
jgi:hypothetical protein